MRWTTTTTKTHLNGFFLVCVAAPLRLIQAGVPIDQFDKDQAINHAPNRGARQIRSGAKRACCCVAFGGASLKRARRGSNGRNGGRQQTSLQTRVCGRRMGHLPTAPSSSSIIQGKKAFGSTHSWPQSAAAAARTCWLPSRMLSIESKSNRRGEAASLGSPSSCSSCCTTTQRTS